MNDQKIICRRCVINSTIPSVEFNNEGICNHCLEYDVIANNFPRDLSTDDKLRVLIEEIKRNRKNSEYDCIVGISGGMDSTYMLYMSKKLGLKPLAVHFDNGWNTEQSVSNVKKAIKKLNIDLYTYVVDWEEFKDLQLSFLKASVPDAEIPTDIAIKSVLYRAAVKNNVKYVLYGGSNFRTEGRIPKEWTYMDGRYIKSVQKKFSTIKLKSFPNYSIWDMFYFIYLKKIKVIRILNYVDFEFKKILDLLRQELDWEYYGGKHYESRYTKFFQAYVLPVKFNIDKRIIHYSSLIRSDQLSRDQALKKLKELPYDKETIQQDKEYVIKKLAITEKEFNDIFSKPNKSFKDYKTYYSFTQSIPVKIIKKLHLWPQLP
jgi:N-acetyl sugar amidotransferase